MSWLFSRALVEEYSAANFSGGGLSAPWSGNLTPQGYSSPDRMTALLRLSHSGMTFAPLMADRGAELLTWFLAASHARTSASQARVQESTASVQVFGEKWLELLDKFLQSLCLSKTVQPFFIGDCGKYEKTWPLWTIPVDGKYFQPVILERHTTENAVGYWPTPTTQGMNGGSSSRKASLSRGIPKEMFSLKKVNPAFLEYLMGWPVGWTELGVSGTDKCLL